MTGRLTIALDAMGGDHAPGAVLRGASIARRRHPNVDFLIFGRSAEVEPMLNRLKRLREHSQFVHTDDAVGSDVKPSIALRTGRKSSMRLAIDAVRDGLAKAVVSSGNTGALMAMAKLALRTVPGVDRPAIASFFPTQRGESVMLDLGANITCDADNLVQFAVMGNAFARSVLGLQAPTYGLLNVGSEEMKGHDAIQEAAAQLRAIQLPGQFHGFVEGDDIAKGTVDVVVTDGFTGNIALKTAEGTVKLYTEFLRATFRHSLLASLGYLLARPAMRKLRARVDPRRYNGAVFLGLNGIAVKSHGGSDALGFAHAVGLAVDLARHGFIDTMRDDFAALAAARSGTAPRAAVS
ncbi:phosphate:acyl-[acyl carrier protein] acyltransferase [Tistlia consotensis]|uniref:Phosphate acyltransferase n=1 Tax=Tistlia consotensis USBA 355 TaxID=560819 RepID=A0A1Y6C3A2_9PROT|nr:phosphate acyltransferase PlsX [Tistlia consotensis]SMF43460.1 phosphate:acyl-[acyl carrier protein] acyltransferase [Tistlia consotensis USBA 355]SNR42539.1 phosphate:acyl-[acyl carrier protein] acyltransferase [Tistlia consotensis]